MYPYCAAPQKRGIGVECMLIPSCDEIVTRFEREYIGSKRPQLTFDFCNNHGKAYLKENYTLELIVVMFDLEYISCLVVQLLSILSPVQQRRIIPGNPSRREGQERSTLGHLGQYRVKG